MSDMTLEERARAVEVLNSMPFGDIGRFINNDNSEFCQKNTDERLWIFTQAIREAENAAYERAAIRIDDILNLYGSDPIYKTMKDTLTYVALTIRGLKHGD